MNLHSNKLLIATHNPAKKQELKEGFVAQLGTSVTTELLSLDDLHITADPEETGTTFLENARLKARYFAGLTGLPTVSDDGGIEIDALGGAPGVHSKRWLGYDATDEEMIQHTLLKLSSTPPEKRTAHFTVCLYFMNPQTGFEKWVFESVNGTIALTPSAKSRKGFPYRALFVVDDYNKYYDELSSSEHSAVNHRLKAIKKLIPLIKEDLIQ